MTVGKVDFLQVICDDKKAVEDPERRTAIPIDWTGGAWRSSGKEAILRVTVAGDWGVCRGYEETLLDRPEGIYGDLLPLLRQSDLNIVNVESVLGNQGQSIPKEGPNLRGDIGTVRSLAQAPFHVACLANNHSMVLVLEG